MTGILAPHLRRAARIGRRVWHRARRGIDARKAAAALEAALARVDAFPTVTAPRRHDLPAPLIISLTSWPPRFATLHLTLRSLLDQQMRPDRVQLWIAHADLAALPAAVRALEAHGLEISACDDLRSYKKLIPAIEAFPDAFIVTADDDVYYPPDWLEALVEGYDAARPHIVAVRAHIARFDPSGLILPYGEWGFDTSRQSASSRRTMLFPTGVGGILYPPHALPPEALDRDAFMGLCPAADDAWFFWMARVNGWAHRRTKKRLPLICWPDTQENALFVANRLHHGNDEQLRNLERAFGPLPLHPRLSCAMAAPKQ